MLALFSIQLESPLTLMYISEIPLPKLLFLFSFALPTMVVDTLLLSWAKF